GKKFVQSNQFLVDDASGTDVLVSHLAVAHHSVGQPHIQPGGRDRRARTFRVQPVVRGLLCKMHGVVGILLRMRVLPPAVANDQKDRCVRYAHNSRSSMKRYPWTSLLSGERPNLPWGLFP